MRQQIAAPRGAAHRTSKIDSAFVSLDTQIKAACFALSGRCRSTALKHRFVLPSANQRGECGNRPSSADVGGLRQEISFDCSSQILRGCAIDVSWKSLKSTIFLACNGWARHELKICARMAIARQRVRACGSQAALIHASSSRHRSTAATNSSGCSKAG